MPKAAASSNRMRSATLSKSTTPAADPILAAIAHHRKLDKAWLALAEAKQPDAERARLAAERAAWQMADTKPSTVAGAAALLGYITTGPVTGLFELGETAWHETAFRNVAASLAKITRASQQAG